MEYLDQCVVLGLYAASRLRISLSVNPSRCPSLLVALLRPASPLGRGTERARRGGGLKDASLTLRFSYVFGLSFVVQVYS